MTLEELARAALDCRRAQKEYFRTRSTGALEASKAAERKLDKAIEEALRQPSLFD